MLLYAALHVIGQVGALGRQRAVLGARRQLNNVVSISASRRADGQRSAQHVAVQQWQLARELNIVVIYLAQHERRGAQLRHRKGVGGHEVPTHDRNWMNNADGWQAQ